MAFDQHSDLPILNPHKRTTKVNFAIVIGVVVFLAISGAMMIWFNTHPHETVPAERKSSP